MNAIGKRSRSGTRSRRGSPGFLRLCPPDSRGSEQRGTEEKKDVLNRHRQLSIVQG
jgi:hypothetical protein